MIGSILLWMASGGVLAILCLLLFWELAQFKGRTVDDVTDFLRPQMPQIDDELFDPAVDEELRSRPVPGIFRRKQRIRLDLAAERYRCKYYHARLLLQWANTEWRDIKRLRSMDEYTPEALENLLTARGRGRVFYRFAPMVMAKLWVMRVALRLDPFLLLPTPDVAPQRRLGRRDMLKVYEEFKLAMVEFARTYGDEQSEELRALM